MRLDAAVAEWRSCRLKLAQRAVRAGEFAVDGRPRLEPKFQLVPGVEPVVELASGRSRVVPPRVHEFWLCHKPAGLICQRHPRAPSVYALLPGESAAGAVGRLDADTTGVLLLTTDGGLASLLLHPTSNVWKVYTATLLAEGGSALDADAAERFRAGLVMDDGATRCAPATLEVLGPASCRVRVHEGRFHQVKRMLAAVGGTVSRLHREAFGVLRCDDLAPGAVRPLRDDELAALVGMLPIDRVAPPAACGVPWREHPPLPGQPAAVT